MKTYRPAGGRSILMRMIRRGVEAPEFGGQVTDAMGAVCPATGGHGRRAA